MVDLMRCGDLRCFSRALHHDIIHLERWVLHRRTRIRCASSIYMAELSGAVAFLDKKIIHGDLTADNILHDECGHACMGRCGLVSRYVVVI
ncbi:hypothetical protein JB92DRAFT_1011935 [Gautieria morchelliformis]|nr:hypothetical protein JB92DRAFT_1011935 [Gautieria morchelliformis]